MRSKEEAERMADAILAAHKQAARPGRATRRSGGAELPSIVERAPLPARWPSIVIAGAATGLVVGMLPTHSAVVGALVGVLIAACIAVIAARFGH